MPGWLLGIVNWAGLVALIGLIPTMYVAIKRTPSQNSVDGATAAKDRADTISILQGLVDEKAKELDERAKSYTTEIAQLRSELAEVKRLSQVPFRVTLEGLTYPAPKILRAEIEILPVEKTATINQGNK
jgi:hypothetical protein